MAKKQEPYPWATYSCPRIGKHKPGVLVSALTASQQRVVWEGIKALDPPLADLMKNDTGLAQLKQAFAAEIFIELHDFNRYIEAGQKVIEEKRHAQTQPAGA